MYTLTVVLTTITVELILAIAYIEAIGLRNRRTMNKQVSELRKRIAEGEIHLVDLPE